MTDREIRLHARGLTKSYLTEGEQVDVLAGLDLTVRAGEFVAVLGSSGSGKSTLLNLLSGLDTPDQGSLTLLDRPLERLSAPERSRLRLEKVGMVFQDYNLVPDFTALENVELLLRAAGIPDSHAQAREALDRVGIAELADRLPRHMSGGQQQRVGIARALAGEREIIFADEPTGALDRANSLMLFESLHQIAAGLGTPVVLCTHDLDALEFCTSAWRLLDGALAAFSAAPASCTPTGEL